MKKTRTYIFDALVNLIAQSVLFFIGMFVWVNPVYEVIWALAAAGFAAFLAFMERGAEKRSGADFRHYLMFSVLPDVYKRQSLPRPLSLPKTLFSLPESPSKAMYSPLYNSEVVLLGMPHRPRPVSYTHLAFQFVGDLWGDKWLFRGGTLLVRENYNLAASVPLTATPNRESRGTSPPCESRAAPSSPLGETSARSADTPCGARLLCAPARSQNVQKR